MGRGPEVAVVVPVHADPDGLRTTLSPLAARGVRVVVVVDGPHPATEAVAREAGAEVIVRPVNGGSYAARQDGVDALGDEVTHVLFTDAGCRPHDGWVDAHLAVLAEADLSGGAVCVTTGTPPTPAAWVDANRYLRQEAYVADGYAATCNLGVRRDVLRRVRFDTTLESGGDRDLCRRAGAAGFRLVYAPDAAVDHPARTTDRAVLAKAARIGRGLAAQPDPSRPPALAVPRLRRGLARAGRRAHGTGWWWGVRVALLDWRRVRATTGAARRAGWTPGDGRGIDAVVLLNARWALLESHNTRWRRVVQAWAADPSVGRVTVVDYPAFRPRRLALPIRLVRPASSWLPGVDAVHVDVPLPPVPTPLDRLVWWWLARSVDRTLPPACGPRVVVATTPLWVPLARRLPAARRALDGMGDWRALGSVRRQRRRVDAGYAEARRLDAVTAVSPGLAATFAELGLAARVVGNGVDLAAFTDDAPAPAGLPDAPFAVYVGALEGRVDLDLLEAVAGAGLPVVVAGPAEGAVADRLSSGPLTWLGPVPTDRVPGLLRAAAVGLVPHHVDALTASMDPMKVLEYLAAGLPVVSTPVALPAAVTEAVTVADREHFAAAAVDAADRPRSHDPHPAVRDRDWSAVATELLAALAGPAAFVR